MYENFERRLAKALKTPYNFTNTRAYSLQVVCYVRMKLLLRLLVGVY